MTPFLLILAFLGALLEVSLLSPLEGLRPDLICIILAFSIVMPRVAPSLVALFTGVVVLELYSNVTFGVLLLSYLTAFLVLRSLTSRLVWGGWRSFAIRVSLMKAIQGISLLPLLLITGSPSSLVSYELGLLPGAVIATLLAGMMLYWPLRRLFALLTLYHVQERPRL